VTNTPQPVPPAAHPRARVILHQQSLLVTNLLLERLNESATARVVTVSSHAAP
jgi:hypothetical protein